MSVCLFVWFDVLVFMSNVVAFGWYVISFELNSAEKIIIVDSEKKGKWSIR